MVSEGASVGAPKEAEDEEASLLLHVRDRTATFETVPSLHTLDSEVEINKHTLLQELGAQCKLSGPLSAGLIANYSLTLISLSFAGHLGTQQLAAAALGSTLYSMSARLVLMGLCGALDTYASQAVGSGNYEALGVIFQRAVLFLLLHTIPISGLFFALPYLLRAMGQSEDFTHRVAAYLMALMPGVWVDALFRPLNRTLVAQRITVPQMWIGGLVALQHVGANYFFIYTLGCGYLGTAYACVWSIILATLLVMAYIRAANLQDRVWGKPDRAVWKGWAAYTRLAYASAAMKCLESWSMSLCTIVAGWLPDPDSSVSAIAVAFNLYGVMYMVFAAQSMAVTTRVGNGLGAGKASMAKLSAAAAGVSAPLIWVVVAIILLLPPSQRMLISFFTNGRDVALLTHMHYLLYWVVLLELVDGLQTVLAGVVSGAGKQSRGFIINLVAFWLLGIPAALFFAFFLRLGVEGLYAGITLGPLCQCFCYAGLVWRLRWEEEAEVARRRMQDASAAL